MPHTLAVENAAQTAWWSRTLAVRGSRGGAILAASMPVMEVVCPCGWSVRGSEREVIDGIRAHARAEHDLAMTERDVRAIWRLVDEAPGQADGGPG